MTLDQELASLTSGSQSWNNQLAMHCHGISICWICLLCVDFPLLSLVSVLIICNLCIQHFVCSIVALVKKVYMGCRQSDIF